MRARGDGHDAVADVRQEQVREREVAEVVGADLHLEAVGGAPLRDRHHAGVVDQDVEVAVPGVGERPHRGEVGEVELPDLGVPSIVAAAGAAPGDVADGEDDARAGAGRSARAATRPMPLLAPVTTKVRPSRAGRSWAVHFEGGHGFKVAADNNAVNANIEPLGSVAWPSASAPTTMATCARPCSPAPSETLSEQGAGELSLRELARQAGVSHAAPRRHFADKQALLDALAEDGFERLGRELREAMDAAGERFEARLLAFARAYVAFATRHAALLELMFAGKHRPGAADSLRAAADRAFEAPLALIAEGQAAGEVVPGEPERVAIVAWAALQGLASMVNSGMLDRPRSTRSSPTPCTGSCSGCGRASHERLARVLDEHEPERLLEPSQPVWLKPSRS